MHAYSANSQQSFNMLVQDISYLKFSQTFYPTGGCTQQWVSSAVERISEVLTQQFRSALPVSLPKQMYHRYLPLFSRLGNTKLS